MDERMRSRQHSQRRRALDQRARAGTEPPEVVHKVLAQAGRLGVERLALSIATRAARSQTGHEDELPCREADGQQAGDEEGQVGGVGAGQRRQRVEVHRHEGRQERLQRREQRYAVDGGTEERGCQCRLRVRDDGPVGHGGARGARVVRRCARAEEAGGPGEREGIDAEADADRGRLDGVEGVEEVVPRRVGEDG